MERPTTADRIAMYVGGGLVLLGSVVIGAVETLFGSPHAVTGDGQIVHEALVPLELRSGIILAGLVVWMLYAVYKLVGTEPAGATGTADAGPAD
jgi:hypothetical protein